MSERRYQVIVIGGGHAGVEAAWAAANLLPVEGGGGATVALVTQDPGKIGVMSCNPAIGGLAKGQLVREIDAMGGVMGLAADATGIQFKVLNTSKGPAVRGPRAQCDKHAYASAVQAMIASRPEIEVIAGSVERLVVEGARIAGVVVQGKKAAAGNEHSRDGNREGAGVGPSSLLSASAVVLTTGTFMRGLMHTGERKTEGGRFGEAAATGISGALRELGFELGRLKTGTPPRLKKSSIAWSELAPQFGDDEPTAFSDLSGRVPSDLAPGDSTLPPSILRFPNLPQVECRETRTTGAVHELIRANLHRAPMYSGQIESVGPRYCPSIEDKVVRFAERDSHGVFLEPESLGDDWVYCNGISTSLPADVQDQIVRAMPGCERAEIYRYGYAVEYDMVRPHQIMATGMTRRVEGLFLAGQINGTSGYEEAGAQGLVAGINAARLARGEGEFIFGRDQAYIGVLMDDLVTKTPIEPYRMFTSRAEHRLLLRSDNSADRLTPVAEKLGMLAASTLGRMRRDYFRERVREIAELNALIETARVDTQPVARALLGSEYTLRALRTALGNPRFAPGTWETVWADRRYEAYIIRQRAEVERQAEMEHRRLPDTIDYTLLTPLRTEARLALAKFRPRTYGQAARLEGVTPADITLLMVLARRPTDGGRRDIVNA